MTEPTHRWLFQRQGYKRPRLLPQRKRVSDRIAMDLARATAEELLACVTKRINDCQDCGIEPDHITKISQQMLIAALAPAVERPGEG